MAANEENDQYAEVFDEGHSAKEHSVHQRLRANSSIMQLKKILGMSCYYPFPPGLARRNSLGIRVGACTPTSRM